MLAKTKSLSIKIQLWLLCCVSVAFVISIALSYISNTKSSVEKTKRLLVDNITDVCNDIHVTDSLVLLTAVTSWTEYFDEYHSFDSADNYLLQELDLVSKTHKIDEISFINEDGIIYMSNIPGLIGYDMASAKQSREFMVLLNNPKVKTLVQRMKKRGIDKKNFHYAACSFARHKGFLQIGLDENHYQDMMAAHLRNSTKYRRVGEYGDLYILDRNANVISAPKDIINEQVAKSGLNKKDILEHKAGEFFEIAVYGVPCYCMYKMEQSYIIVALQPVSEATKTRHNVVLTTSINESVIFLILIFAIWLLIKYLVVDNIGKINCSLAKITEGDFNEVISVGGSNEFDKLSYGINETVKSLKTYIHKAETRLDNELTLAKDIQRSMLPQTVNIPQLTLDSCIIPARNVSGDLYYYFTRNNYLYFCIGDVSGKGLPASLFMSKTISLYTCISRYAVRADDIAEQLNIELCQNNSRSMFVTMFIGIINLTSGELQYCNAGHDEPLYWNGLDSSKPRYLSTSDNIPLGVDDNEPFTQCEVYLKAGSRLFLYTDGVTEAKRRDLEMYGEERLLDCFSKCCEDSRKPMCNSVLMDVRKFVGDNQQSDDITMLSIAIKHIDKTIVLKNDISELKKLPDFFDNIAKVLIYSPEQLIQVRMAIDEVMTNCIRYAYTDSHEDGENQLVFLRVYTANGQIVFVITDQGIPFDPLTYKEHSFEDIQNLDIDDIKIGGLGIPLMKKTFDELDYQRISNKNILTLKKNLNKKSHGN